MGCAKVTPFGFEPKTYCLEGSCSIQLSYGASNFCLTSNVLLVEKGKKKGMISHPLSVGVARFELTTSCSQSRRDTGLRYTPRKISLFSLICQSFLFRCAKIRTFSYYASFLLRWRRDSNSRYSYPYVSLANWWF